MTSRFVIGLVVLVLGMAPRPTDQVAPLSGGHCDAAKQIVRASWYGREARGRITASGQPFDDGALTVASRSLPFGTVLLLHRGRRSVVVTVNDRGPFVRGRDLDLSAETARRLGISGVARVSMEMF